MRCKIEMSIPGKMLSNVSYLNVAMNCLNGAKNPNPVMFDYEDKSKIQSYKI
jgi:hypothetical protein